MLWMIRLLFGLFALATPLSAPSIQVDGQPLSESAWRFLCLTRGVGENSEAKDFKQIEEQWIDRHLIRQFLSQQKVPLQEELLELRLLELDELIKRREASPETVYQKFGLTREQIRQELALSVGWETFIEQQTSQEQLQKIFSERGESINGTRVHAWQIFLPAKTDAEWMQAKLTLEEVAQKIQDQSLTFEKGAEQFSKAPSRTKGGDQGWITGLGQLPAEVAQAALRMKPGQVPLLIRSSFGAHLIRVTEKEPGELSLEDVRPRLLQEISNSLWSATCAQLRKKARITRQ